VTRGSLSQQPVSRLEVTHRQSGKSPTGVVYSRISCCRYRVRSVEARLGKQFSRNIKAANLGIFIQISQNIRQLQGVTKALSKILTLLFLHPEDASGKSTDGAGHPVAIDT